MFKRNWKEYKMSNRPNILFVLSDQHNAKVLGCKGHPDVKTPNLDRLAEQGVRFENAIAQNPICTPSRVSWLSGQYPHNHGYYGLSGPNPNGLPNIIGHFRKAGYKTAAIGKIHCPEYWIEDSCDVYHETTKGCSIGGRSLEYAEYLAERGLTDLEDHGALNEFGKQGRQSVDARPSKVSYEDGQEGWAVRKAMEFMSQCAKDKQKFFLHVSLPKPHQCYTPAKQFWDLYDESKLTLPPNAEYNMEDAKKAPHLIRAMRVWREWKWQLFEPKTFEAGRLRKLHGYLGNISHVDYAVGELMDWLKQNGLEEDTIIIYSADHGDYACEHGIMEKAPGICSDAITRIPFICRWPSRFKAGHIVTEIVETVDLSNTLCSLAGLDPMMTADGKDISYLLEGKTGQAHNIAVTEFVWSKSVRKGKYRLVYYPREMFAKEYPDGFGELYDLEADPWEMKNLYFESEYINIIQELQKELFDWLITTTRPKTIHPNVLMNGNQWITRYDNSVNADDKLTPGIIRQIQQKHCNYI